MKCYLLSLCADEKLADWACYRPREEAWILQANVCCNKWERQARKRAGSRAVKSGLQLTLHLHLPGIWTSHIVASKFTPGTKFRQNYNRFTAVGRAFEGRGWEAEDERARKVRENVTHTHYGGPGRLWSPLKGAAQSYTYLYSAYAGLSKLMT